MKLVKFIGAVFSVLFLLFSAIDAADKQVDKNIEIQNAHMEYLQNEFYKNYTPVNESAVTGFDVEKAVNNNVKFNEIKFLGTHNSYQIAATEEYKKLYNAVSDLTFGIVNNKKANFTMDTLTEQFECGIRNVEIDIETVVQDEKVSFIVSHDPSLDNTSSCFDFEKALEEIKMWSDSNQNHLPVTIIIEPKKNVPPIRNMKNFTLEYANELDNLLRDVLGDKLLTPADMMGEYESLKEMRLDDGWLPVKDTLGKVIVLLHDTTVTNDYIKQDETIKTQAMFPMLRYDDRNESYASFIIDNEPEKALKHEEESIDKCNLIVRTRADSFPSYSDERYENADKCRSQIISTDYPPRYSENGNHTYTFGGATVKLIEKY